MTTYATSEPFPPFDDDGELRVSRTPNVTTLAFTVISITGGGTGTIDTGPGGTDGGTASQRFSVWIA